MWIELSGTFYRNTEERKAYVNTDCIEFFTNTHSSSDGRYYIFIQLAGHYIEWNCAGEKELMKRYNWLTAIVSEKDTVSFGEQEPIEPIKEFLL